MTVISGRQIEQSTRMDTRVEWRMNGTPARSPFMPRQGIGWSGREVGGGGGGGKRVEGEGSGWRGRDVSGGGGKCVERKRCEWRGGKWVEGKGCE